MPGEFYTSLSHSHWYRIRRADHVVPASCTVQHCGYTVYDYGQASVTIGTTTQSIPFTQGSTSSSLASSLAAAFNGNASSPVSATVSGNVIQFTSKATGTASNYPMSVSVTYKTQNFSASSFTLTASGSSLAGGTNAVAPGAAPLQENYSLDPWGNMQQSGNFSFTQAFTTNNQISGFSYDAAGDILNDGMNTYTYDSEGMLTSSGGAQYVYDALQQRVEKTGGSNPGEVVYFNGRPLALLNPASNSWTDLIWAGSSLIAEVPGSQSGSAVYRLLDHEGSLAATVNSTGGLLATNLFTPYGQSMNSGTGDAYSWTGLFQDTEYSGDAAWYRNYSTRQARWLTPDPYNGSYDLYDPQSFNRYMYVSGNPLGFTDPSGLSVASDLCSILPTFFLNPNANLFNDLNNASKLVGYANQVAKNSCSGTLEAGAEFAAKYFIAYSLSSQSDNSTYLSTSAYLAYIQAALAIGCSVDYSSKVCGPPQLAWLIPGGGGDVGKATGDLVAVGAAICIGGGFTDPACDAVAIYELANSVYGFFYNLLGWSGPQFTGSLLPRPSDLGGLGTAPTGIPNQNLSIKSILSQHSHGFILSPGVNIQ